MSRTLSIRLAAVLAAATLALHGAAWTQTPPPVPAGPPAIVCLQTFGPAAWRARLGPTNLGSMLASERAESIWRSYVDDAKASLRHARRDEVAFTREWTRVLDYGGAIAVVVWLEQAEDALHSARWSMAIVGEPDGHTDLAALAAESAGWLGDSLGKERGRQWRDLTLVPPQVRDGRLVAVVACTEDADAVIARAVALRLPAPPAPTALHVEIEVDEALGLARDRPQDRDWLRALVGKATQRVTFDLGCAGPRLALDTGVEFTAGDRGMLGGLLPIGKGVPAMEWLIPEGTAAHMTGHVDLTALWSTAVAAEAELRETDAATVSKQWAKHLGLDVATDLAPHFADHAMLLWQASASEDKDRALLGNLCIVVPLRDEPAAVAGLTALLPKLGHRAQVRQGVFLAERAGVLWMPALCLGIANDVACLAVGGNGREQVLAVIDRAAGGPPRTNPRAPEPAAPAGWNGAGRIDVEIMLGRHLASLGTLLRALTGATLKLPRHDSLAREANRWLPLLQQHGLAVATRLSGATPTTWQQRVLW
ncbi:MAG TPA: hypothetical protein VF384_11355 [Planctomycetota bacterium]